MRKGIYLFSGLVLFGSLVYLAGCNSAQEKPDTTATAENKPLSQDEIVKKGHYIVSTGACNDCHSPKIMTQMGPVPDSTRLLSGFPAGEPLPPVPADAGKPTSWIEMSPDATSFVGPWGISYAANLTPDSATGIGAWSEDQFLNTLKNGKHLGNGRPLLPPMPWPDFGKKTDDDLKAIFAYLRTLPPIKHRVDNTLPPTYCKICKQKHGGGDQN